MLRFLQQVGFKFQLLFMGLFMLTVPFKQGWLPNWGSFFNPLTKSLAEWIGDHIFSIEGAYTPALMSDSTGLYIYSLFLVLLSIQIALIWQAFGQKKLSKAVHYWFSTTISYFLALHLLAYGTSKLFKVQFFLPEPNTLYTPLGELTPDILFWSTMGSAYGYTVFSGIIEIIPALLLLFRPTRSLGALIALGVMTNVLALNLGFDISVKLFSSFLLLSSVLILLPSAKTFYQFFCLQQSVGLKTYSPKLTKWPYRISKFLALGLIVLNAFLPYIQTQNFNDDQATRPFLHGAYAVDDFYWNGEEIEACFDQTSGWQRVFIHRRGYFIIQNMQGKFQDFKLDIQNNQLLLKDYKDQTHTLKYSYNEKQLFLHGKINGFPIKLKATPLDWEELPLIKGAFHWTIDDL